MTTVQIKQKTFACKRCGWCCENIVINVSHSDILRWLSQQRHEILENISFIDNYPKKGTGGFYIRQTALNPKQACPFLVYDNKLTGCSIQETKPRACREAPLGYDKFSDCPAFEPASNQTQETIKKNQYEDFRLAFINRDQLLNVLVKMRRGG